MKHETTFLTEPTKQLLLQTANRLDFLTKTYRINQEKGQLHNNWVAKTFCGRCFGAVLDECFSDSRVLKFDYSRGVRKLHDKLMEGRHYRNWFERGPLGTDGCVAGYLTEYCNAPPRPFSINNWLKNRSMGDTIRKAVELNS